MNCKDCPKERAAYMVSCSNGKGIWGNSYILASEEELKEELNSKKERHEKVTYKPITFYQYEKAKKGKVI